MLTSRGIAFDTVATRLAGNTAGILMSKKANTDFVNKYGEVTLPKILDAVLAGDLLLVLSADGQGPGLLRAVQAAHERELSVLALTGAGGGALARELRDTDVHVSVPSESAAHVHEAHLRALHCVCEGLDQQLLGDEESAS